MVPVESLVSALDKAVQHPNSETIVRQVKEVLVKTCKEGLDLPSRCFQPCSETYARHLLYLDPARRYSIVVMVWGPNQGTPLHDHGHLWCVECVLDGRISVTQYAHTGTTAEGLDRFERQETIFSETGEAGYLIPPFEYHTISNAEESTATITMHVYGGDYQECSVFFPMHDDLYRREIKQMRFDD